MADQMERFLIEISDGIVDAKKAGRTPKTIYIHPVDAINKLGSGIDPDFEGEIGLFFGLPIYTDKAVDEGEYLIGDI